MGRRERDEVGHLLRLDTVPLAYLLGSYACHLAGAHGLKDRRELGGELKSIGVTGCHESCSAASLFIGYGRRQEIVSFVSRTLGIEEAARGNELRQHLKLFEQLGVKLTSALILRERTVTVSWNVQRVPGNQHRPRPLALIQSQ
jgi:hypothetical protein